ncbi:MAG: peroxiredoxin Q/BCP [Sphingobacteriales bacterium]|jgi:peroxiredoxin Q/BCP
MTHLKIGDQAPNFKGIVQDGREIKLEDYKGNKLIVFFYPRDNTPTCTTTACNLRDNYEDLVKAGYKVIGVSTDTEKKHQNFIKKYNFQYDLIADVDKEVHSAFGVWGPKKFMGREFDGTIRTTFVIDEKGVIENVISKVKAGTHTEQILSN